MMTAYNQLNDAELLALLSRDKEKAFTELYNRYWKKLFRIAAGRLGNLYEAEEIVQDIFLDIWKRRNTLPAINSFSSFLSVAVNFKVINILARRSLLLRFSKELSYHKNDVDSCTEQWLNFEELKSNLHKLVSELPEKCQLVFELSREKGLSQKEIASRLNISGKTVEAHLTRALHSLRALLGMLLVLFC